MGMYTELYLTVELKEDTPQDIIDILTVICGGKRLIETERTPGKEREEDKVEYFSDRSPDVFSSDRIWSLARSSSYYFAGDPLSSLRYDSISRSYHMTMRGDIKNYGDEIDEFLSWLQPHVEPRGYAGHIRYEEDYMPTLIFFRKAGLRLVELGILSLLDWEKEES